MKIPEGKKSTYSVDIWHRKYGGTNPIDLYYSVQIVIDRWAPIRFARENEYVSRGRDAPSKRDRSLWACPRTERRQVFRSSLPLLLPLRLLSSSPFVEIVLSRLCAHVLYCFVSRAHLSDSGARQSAKDAEPVSLPLDLPPSLSVPRETLFLGAFIPSFFVRA